MTHVRRLFESIPFTKLVPDQSIIVDGPKTGGAKIRAARSSDGSFAIVYSPFGESCTLNKHVIKGRRVREVWYDPRYGVSYEVHQTDSWGYQRYTPVTNGRGNDWVLLLEDVAAGYVLPNPPALKRAVALPIVRDLAFHLNIVLVGNYVRCVICLGAVGKNTGQRHQRRTGKR